ncbi:SusC/RagA family TonB-linked outer membrane protein [Runella sp.]|uniref:SusC/RagA family TonB-linked outer membrane protein n=1 Tax=Runella sp. TaxID=1960881 RepID=UPI002624BA0D|nr:SusC/RagA family TonB-linked outer membrane protein [Runella sp.]
MKQLLHRSVILLVCWGASFSLLAQDRVISGKVTNSADNTTLPGVSIIVKGTSRGTTTDNNGEFKVSAPNNATLIFSYIGYLRQEVKIGTSNVINISLDNDENTLNEVVVTAFGISKEKRSLGYAVQEVKGDEIAETQRENFLTAIQSRVAGATINTTSGAPGASSQIVLRSPNSLSGNNSPLIVVDGIPIDNSTLSQSILTSDGANRNNDYTNRAADINPNDIASITILKGPEAAAKYGINAGSGAIIITTKKGAPGKLRLSYDNSFRLDQTYLFPEVQKEFDLGTFGVNDLRTRLAWGQRYAPNTQFYENVRNFFQDAVTQRHNFSLDGGFKQFTYRGSFGSVKQDGTIPNTGYDRLNGRGTLVYKSKSQKLDITTTAAYTHSTNQKAQRGAGGFLQALLSWPLDDDASAYQNADGSRRKIIDDPNIVELDNPFWIVYKNESSDRTNRWTYNVSGNYKPTEWLNFTARLGYDTYHTDGNSFYHPESNDFRTVKGRIENYTVDYQGLNGVFIGTATKNFGKFKNSFQVGTEITDYRSKFFSERGENLTKVGEGYVNDISTIDPRTRFDSRSLGRDTLQLRRLQGLFAEYTFSYNDWLNFTLTGRNDWTSTLPKEARSFFYPAASLSFVFSDLLPQSKVFSFGKLRASIAETAKDISPYQSQSVYARQITSGGGFSYGFTNNNPFIVPERQRTYELGTELSFWNKRLGVDFTYYNTRNIGQIVRLVRLSYGTGFVLSTLNVADTRNQGVELVLTGQVVKKKGFSWDALVNFARTRNQVLNLPSNIPEYYNSDTWLDAFRNGLIPGGTTTTLTGQDYLRNSKGQILIDPGTGFPLVNPNYIKIAERNPNFTMGVQNTFRMKGFSLSFLLDIRSGGDIMNGTAYWMTARGYSPRTTNREQPIIVPGVLNDGLQETDKPSPNTIQILPYYQSNYYSDGRLYASNFVEKNINWVRMRDLTFAYNFPKTLVQKWKYVSDARLFFTGTDLFILSNYSGADPSVNGNGASTSGVGSFGVDYFSPSTPRGFNIGLKLGLKNR